MRGYGANESCYSRPRRDSMPINQQMSLNNFIQSTSLILKNVNGYNLNADQEKWVRWIKQWTLPNLPKDNPNATPLQMVARVTWWALREGVLDEKNPFSYSNCEYSSGQKIIGPLEVCPQWKSYRAWQVGIAAVQVQNPSDTEVENMSIKAYKPIIGNKVTIKDVLCRAADQAGYKAGTSEYNTICNSSGNLRKSWLLRSHLVGFWFAEIEVRTECLISSVKSWCISADYTAAKQFASNKSAIDKSIADLTTYFKSSSL
ncbi:8505_t:CDS:2 [Acaulospora morrowiae]|uniref:8505_t:CDS:1 n=1 Tax=Acaulospora morrowiae TaxID=94023 RepID=A0A9N9C468_9GLOM|nr:8505_t:CDS:2 [Acaulospora morrowiae]